MFKILHNLLYLTLTLILIHGSCLDMENLIQFTSHMKDNVAPNGGVS